MKLTKREIELMIEALVLLRESRTRGTIDHATTSSDVKRLIKALEAEKNES